MATVQQMVIHSSRAARLAGSGFYVRADIAMKKQETPRTKILDAFQPLVDEESFYWLDSEHPQYMVVLERFVHDDTINPENLGRTLFSTMSHRPEFIKACQGALRHLRSKYSDE